MSEAKPKKALLPERAAAWIAAFLLTAAVTLTVLGALAVQVLTSAGLHLRTATDGKLLDEQLQSIYASVDEYAEAYGFSADPVKAAVSREELEQFNTKAAEWWIALLTEGKADVIPRWNPGNLTEAVSAAMEGKEQKENPAAIASDLAEIAERTVFPIRGSLIARGMELAGSYADIPGIIRAVRKLPLLGLAVCVLLAGVIALLMGREILRSLKHYGTALAGAGFAILSAVILLAAMQPGEILEEASRGLSGEFSTLAGNLFPETAGVILALIAAGYACLFLYRRKAGKDRLTAAERGT